MCRSFERGTFGTSPLDSVPSCAVNVPSFVDVFVVGVPFCVPLLYVPSLFRNVPLVLLACSTHTSIRSLDMRIL